MGLLGMMSLELLGSERTMLQVGCWLPANVSGLQPEGPNVLM